MPHKDIETQQISRKLLLSYKLSLIFSISFGFLILLFSLSWEPWSYRYFAPWIMIGLLLLFTYTSYHLRTKYYFLLILPCLFLIIFNVMLSCYPFSEGRPVSFITAFNQSQMQRKLALHPDMYNGAGKLVSILPFGHNLSILIVNQINAATYPFFGDNHQNQVQLADSVQTFSGDILTHRYDLIVFSGQDLSYLESKLQSILFIRGYKLIVTSPYWHVYKVIEQKPSSQ